MEQRTTKLGQHLAKTLEAPPLPNPEPQAAAFEVKHLVRTIGQSEGPETQHFTKVNAELAAFLNLGWTIHTVRPLGIVPGGVQIFYLLVKSN